MATEITLTYGLLLRTSMSACTWFCLQAPTLMLWSQYSTLQWKILSLLERRKRILKLVLQCLQLRDRFLHHWTQNCHNFVTVWLFWFLHSSKLIHYSIDSTPDIVHRSYVRYTISNHCMQTVRYIDRYKISFWHQECCIYILVDFHTGPGTKTN